LNYVAHAWLAGLALASAGAAAQTADQLERVTITAEKRETVLDMTPDAISVLDGRKLQERGEAGLSDVATTVPNVNFTTMFGSTQLFIRGIGNVFITAGGDPGVALYTDGAYVSDMTSSNTALFDVQRVEVLRGPQGALYGRNATGGAVNIISARPTDAFSARAGLLFGNYGRKETEGFASGPLGESGTKVRLSWQVKSLAGYTTNPLGGQTFGPVLPGGPTTVAPKRMDDLGSRALRLQTQSDFDGGASLRLIAGHYRQRDNGLPNPVLLDDPTPLTPEIIFGARPSTDPRVVKSGGAYRHIDVDSLQAIYDQPIGDKTLTVVGSWRRSHSDYFTDGDTTEAPVATTRFDTRGRDASIDAHLASGDSGALQWLVGATALRFNQKQDIDVPVVIPGSWASAAFGLPPMSPTTPFPLEFLLGGNVVTRSVAAYTDLRYAIAPKFALLGGLRLNHDSKSAEEYNSFLPSIAPLSAGWSSTPWSLGAEWQPAADVLTYAKVSHGFKSGAVNLGAGQGSAVKPETAISLELGTKINFMDRRASLAAALFTSRYKDMQVVQTGQAAPILGNAAGARISGLELEALVKPVSSLTLGANVGLMDPKYTDFVNTDQRHAPLGPPVNVAGNQLANVSKAQAALSADWTQPVGDWRASLRAEYVWRGAYYFTEFNTADAKQGAFGMVNLSFALQPAQGHWRVYGYVKNLTNVTALSAMNITSPLLGAPRTVNYVPPRNFGVGLAYDF
jgi:outer membrane receptor protein involved in Fe transport